MTSGKNGEHSAGGRRLVLSAQPLSQAIDQIADLHHADMMAGVGRSQQDHGRLRARLVVLVASCPFACDGARSPNWAATALPGGGPLSAGRTILVRGVQPRRCRLSAAHVARRRAAGGASDGELSLDFFLWFPNRNGRLRAGSTGIFSHRIGIRRDYRGRIMRRRKSSIFAASSDDAGGPSACSASCFRIRSALPGRLTLHLRRD